MKEFDFFSKICMAIALVAIFTALIITTTCCYMVY